MKAIEAIYKFGNLYDKTTKKRLLIEDGTQVALVIESGKLLDQDPNLKLRTFLDYKKKLIAMQAFAQKDESTKFWKLYDSGAVFYFDISAGVKRKDQTDSIKCTFQLRLLEDLYVYNKKKEPSDARFFDCHCIVEECLDNFEFFEPVYAKSLNDACTKTYELYFAMFGKSTANAFDRVYSGHNRTPIRVAAEEIQKTKPNNQH